MKKIVLAAAAALLMAVLATEAAQAGEKPDGALDGQEIKEYFAKTRIYGTTPGGNSWFVQFQENGTAKGVTHKDSDQGKWWVEGDTLCRNWTAWAARAGKQEACFYVVLDKANKRIDYLNPDGSLYRSWMMGG